MTDPVTTEPRTTGGRRVLLSVVGTIALATLAARVVGFVRWLVFSGNVGGTCVGQVYATANQVPNVLFEVAAGGALAAVVVPLVAAALARGARAEADAVASALVTWALAVLIPLTVLLSILAPAITSALLGPDATCGPGQHSLAVRMLLVFAPQVPLYAVGIILAGVLQAHRRFLAAAVAPLASSLVVIVAYLVYGLLNRGGDGSIAGLDGLSEAVLTGGTTLGVVALSLPLLLPIRRAGVRLHLRWRFPPGAAARAGRLAGAGMVALVAQQVSVLATVWISNHRGGTGTLNVYSYVQAVYLLPYAVLAVPIATAAFPSLVDADPDAAPSAGSADTLARSLRAVLAAGVVGASVLFAVAGPVGTFFGALDVGRDHGAAAALGAFDDALSAFAPGLVGFAVAAVAQRALYARHRSWATGLVVAGGWVIAAVLPFVLTAPRVDAGAALRSLGLSASIGMTLAGLALLVLVSRSWGAGVLRPVLRSGLVLLPAGVVAALAGRWVAGAVDPRGLLAAVLTGVAAAAVTSALLCLVLIALDRATWRALVRRGGEPAVDAGGASGTRGAARAADDRPVTPEEDA